MSPAPAKHLAMSLKQKKEDSDVSKTCQNLAGKDLKLMQAMTLPVS